MGMAARKRLRAMLCGEWLRKARPRPFSEVVEGPETGGKDGIPRRSAKASGERSPRSITPCGTATLAESVVTAHGVTSTISTSSRKNFGNRPSAIVLMPKTTCTGRGALRSHVGSGHVPSPEIGDGPPVGRRFANRGHADRRTPTRRLAEPIDPAIKHHVPARVAGLLSLRLEILTAVTVSQRVAVPGHHRDLLHQFHEPPPLPPLALRRNTS